MSFFAPFLVGRIPVAALANPPALIELFAETIVEELDFRLEAANMLDVGHVLAETNQRSIIVPRPHPTLVTRRMLVMERLDGFAWDDVAGMRAAGIDTTAVLRAEMVSFLEGALLYGVFHGDLHGGNLFVQHDGRVALLDHGITGRLGERQRLAFLQLLIGGTTNNIPIQVQALKELGALPRRRRCRAGHQRSRPRQARAGRDHHVGRRAHRAAARSHQAAARLRSEDAEGADAVREGPVVSRRSGRDARARDRPARRSGPHRHLLRRTPRRAHRLRDRARPANGSRSTSTGCAPRWVCRPRPSSSPTASCRNVARCSAGNSSVENPRSQHEVETAVST